MTTNGPTQLECKNCGSNELIYHDGCWKCAYCDSVFYFPDLVRDKDDLDDDDLDGYTYADGYAEGFSDGFTDPRSRATPYTAYEQPVIPNSPKSRAVAFVLCFFVGYFGAHYFYVNRPFMGILFLLTFGLCGIGWVVDLIRILCGRLRDSNGLRVR